ncbi:hypothetical protein, partial [Tateyamaria sp.]|uniref:hypothetical protein n=1 Tax=Tateyamaria sp. TaxID=1929288 RepID=UPI0032DCF501
SRSAQTASLQEFRRATSSTGFRGPELLDQKDGSRKNHRCVQSIAAPKKDQIKLAAIRPRRKSEPCRSF